MYDNDNVLGLAEGCAIDVDVNDNLFRSTDYIFVNANLDSNLNTGASLNSEF